jgi:adenylate kinase family enzyme
MHLYSYYSRKNILTTINVDKPIDKINKELEDLILKNL